MNPVVFLVLLIGVNILTRNAYKPWGFHGWPAAVVIIGLAIALVIVWPHLQTMLKATPAYGASPHSTPSVTPTTLLTKQTQGVSAGFVNRILAAHHSPAQGLGTVFVAQGHQAGIDPLYALGFFDEESKYGTIGWPRCLGGYRAYASWADGIADWFTVIHDVYLTQGRTTLASILPVYAPTNNLNNPTTYMHAVCQDVNQWRQGKVE